MGKGLPFFPSRFRLIFLDIGTQLMGVEREPEAGKRLRHPFPRLLRLAAQFAPKMQSDQSTGDGKNEAIPSDRQKLNSQVPGSRTEETE